MMCEKFDFHQDNHTAAAGICQYALLAYNFGLDMITTTFTAFLTYSFIVFKNERTAGADVGLAITQALILCGIMARGIRLTADIETLVVSVERLFQYTKLKPEEVGNEKPSSSWPDHGKIEFKNVCLTYLKGTPTLNDIQFSIQPGEKV